MISEVLATAKWSCLFRLQDVLGEAGAVDKLNWVAVVGILDNYGHAVCWYLPGWTRGGLCRCDRW